jgi:isochorismate hydrolase
MLLDPAKALLMVVDIQDRLVPHMDGAGPMLEACGRLIAAARRLQVPVLACEQYPQGLGPTDARLRGRLDEDAILAKTRFSALGEPLIAERVRTADPAQVVVCGLEAHVCVLQTALALKAEGRAAFVAADAVASRRASDKALALQRLAAAGVWIVSLEMVLFEWAGDARGPRFQAIRDLVREPVS